MNYVLIGSLGNVNRPLVDRLVAGGHNVTVISSQSERSAAIQAAGARPAIGAIEDGRFLADTFRGADAVYTMIPPHYSASDWMVYFKETGKVLASALAAAGIKKVVNLSSTGAHLPEGCGPVSGLYFVEQELNRLSGVDVVHLRPGFFYTNFLNLIGMIKNAGIFANSYGGDRLLYLTSPADIAEAAAEELVSLAFTGKTVRYIISDEKTSREVTAILGAAIGQPQLPYVELSDEENLQGLLQMGLPEDVAKNFVELGRAARTGEMFEDYLKHPVALSGTKLTDFAKIFAAAYQANS